MPIFSEPVEVLAAVGLFARMAGHQQVLVCDLRLTTEVGTALIFPIPVRHGLGPDGVRFIPIHEYRSFMGRLASGFVPRTANSARRQADEDASPRTVRFVSQSATRSIYLPSVSAFERLPTRYRIPEAVLSVHPEYQDFAFVVFVLPPGRNLRIRPMGVTFDSRDASRLFLPSYQCTNSSISSSAVYDMTLYCQRAELAGWEETLSPASEFIDAARCQGAVEPARVVQRRVLYGVQPNEDLWVPTS